MAEPSTKRARTEPEPADTPLAALLAKIRTYIRAAPILFIDGEARYVNAEHVSIPIPMKGPLPSDELLGKSDYLLQSRWFASAEHAAGKPFPTPDNGMVQNWEDNPAWVNFLLGHPDILTIFEAIFGRDFRLVIERFCQQNKPRENLAQLEATCHRDHPKWEKRSPRELPASTLITRRPGEIVIIIIDQGKAHAIPKQGNSKGVFVGALTPPQHEAYETATLAQLKRPLAARPQYWPELRKLGSLSEITAALLLFAARPIVFPSCKPIAVPAGYNGSRYKHFAGYFPPVERRYATADVLARIRHKHGDRIAEPFAAAIAKLQHQHCAKDPSLLSTDVLRRFFGY